jgi:MFS transporter, Spinster family, sphingosine-1-phosphate transporter
MTDTSRSPSAVAIPGARLALGLLLAINLLNYVDRMVLAAVVPQIKDSLPTGPTLTAVVSWLQQRIGFKPEDALIGVLGTAFMVTYMIGAPVFARLAESYSRWVLVGIGVALWSLASGASGLAGTLAILLITRCFVGIGEAAYGPVAPTIISDWYPVEKRGQALAWFYSAIPVGSALGYGLGGLVVNSGIGNWGSAVIGAHHENWRWAFYLVVVPGLILGALSLFMREPPRGQADPGAGHGRQKVRWSDYVLLFRTPSYVYCTIGMTAMTFAIGGISMWMPYYLQKQRGVSAWESAVLFGGIVALAGLTATLAGGIAGDKLRRRFPGSYFLVSGTAMMLGFPLFLATLYVPVAWIWPLIFMTLFCLFFNTGPTNTILANVTHPSMRAAGFAVNILVIHALGDVTSPVVVGLLNDYFGHDMNKSFLVVGVMFLVAGVAWLFGMRHLQRDTELAPTRMAVR